MAQKSRIAPLLKKVRNLGAPSLLAIGLVVVIGLGYSYAPTISKQISLNSSSQLAAAYNANYDYDNNGVLDDADVAILTEVAVGSATCPANKTCNTDGKTSATGAAVTSADGLFLLKYITTRVVAPPTVPSRSGPPPKLTVSVAEPAPKAIVSPLHPDRVSFTINFVVSAGSDDVYIVRRISPKRTLMAGDGVVYKVNKHYLMDFSEIASSLSTEVSIKGDTASAFRVPANRSRTFTFKLSGSVKSSGYSLRSGGYIAASLDTINWSLTPMDMNNFYYPLEREGVILKTNDVFIKMR